MRPALSSLPDALVYPPDMLLCTPLHACLHTHLTRHSHTRLRRQSARTLIYLPTHLHTHPRTRLSSRTIQIQKVVSTVKKNERQDIAGIKTELEATPINLFDLFALATLLTPIDRRPRSQALRASNEELEGAVHSLSVSFCETYGPQ